MAQRLFIANLDGRTLSVNATILCYFWCCDSLATAKDELIRLRFIPRESGEPYKVITVCLPFVYAKRSTGKLVTLDIRKHQLVKLDQASGKKVWKRMKKVV